MNHNSEVNDWYKLVKVTSIRIMGSAVVLITFLESGFVSVRNFIDDLLYEEL